MKMRSATAWLLAALLPVCFGEAYADVDTQRAKGVAWLLKQQRGDGGWATADGSLSVQASAAALLALKSAGVTRAPAYGAVGAWLANADADSVDSIARKVEALSAGGLPSSAQLESDRLYAKRSLASSATWGGYGGAGVDYIDTLLGLTALRTGDAGYSGKAGNTTPTALCTLFNARINVASGKQALPLTQAVTAQSAVQGRPSVLATALLVAELPNILKSAGFSAINCPTSYTFATVQAEGVAWLLDQQNADGGFGEQRADGTKGASSVLASALVYRAFASQAAPPATATASLLNWLLAQQNASNGSWKGDPLVTAQVLAVLPAAAGAQLADTDHDGLPDVVEAQLGSNPAVADARQFIGAPTQSVPGTSSARVLAGGKVGNVFTYTLPGGAPFGIGAGSLPPGLTLNAATGVISGTPTQAGSYSFDMTSAASADAVIARIDVDPADTVTVPLPPWALVVMGGALMAAIHRRRRSA